MVGHIEPRKPLGVFPSERNVVEQRDSLIAEYVENVVEINGLGATRIVTGEGRAAWVCVDIELSDDGFTKTL